MKYFAIIIWLKLFVPLTNSGQIDFSCRISSLQDDFPTSAVQIGSGNFIIATARGNYASQNYNPIAYKISKDGNIIDSLSFLLSATYACIYELCFVQESIVGIGSIRDSTDKTFLWLCQFDTAMVFISEQFFLTPFD
jgi:hypothetical protein